KTPTATRSNCCPPAAETDSGVERSRATPALSARIRRRAVLATRPGAPPEGTSTSSSAVRQETAFIEPAGVPGCSHPGRVLLQGHDGQERSTEPAPPGAPSTTSSAAEPAQPVIQPPGATGCSHPGPALRRAGTPGRDEHQLVRGAAGALVHRASRGTRLFAPGAGAPTGARRSGEAHSSSPIAARGLDVPRKRAPPGCSAPALRHPQPPTESPRRMYAPYLRRHIRGIQIRHPGNEINHPHIA